MPHLDGSASRCAESPTRTPCAKPQGVAPGFLGGRFSRSGWSIFRCAIGGWLGLTLWEAPADRAGPAIIEPPPGHRRASAPATRRGTIMLLMSTAIDGYGVLDKTVVLELFEEIQASTDINVARSLCARLLDQHPSLTVEATSRHLMWRARRCGSAEGFASIFDLVAPPPEQTSVGRLNHHGKPVLYVANSPETALAECDASPGEYFHMVGFIVPGTSRMRAAIVGEQYHSYRTGYMKHFGIDPQQTVFQNVRQLGIDRGKNVFFTDSLLADILTDDDAKHRSYVSTRALADNILHKNPACQGIYFPSIKHELGTNMAFHLGSGCVLLKAVTSHVVRVDKRFRNGFFDCCTVKTVEHIEEDGCLFKSTRVSRSDVKLFGVTEDEKQRITSSFERVSDSEHTAADDSD